jgi:ferredoxin
VTVDETGASAARAYVALVDEAMQLGEWREVAVEHLPVEEWQRTLATNAGYEDFVKWRCNRCESVCPGEAAEVPAPCEFCGGGEIEQVAITTPLSDPRPPYDEEQGNGMPRDR